MFATFITLALISFAVAGLRDLARHDGAKIIAALQGNSRPVYRSLQFAE